MMAGYAVISIGEVVGVGERPGKRHTTSRTRGGRSRIFEKQIQELCKGKSKKITENQQQKERSENLPGKERE